MGALAPQIVQDLHRTGGCNVGSVPEVARPLGVPGGPKQDKAVAFDITAACGKRVDADRTDVHAAYNRTWSAQGWWVCQTAKRPDNTFVSCVALLARGTLVSTVWSVHGSSRQDNTSGVKQVAAIGADALRKASP